MHGWIERNVYKKKSKQKLSIRVDNTNSERFTWILHLGYDFISRCQGNVWFIITFIARVARTIKIRTSDRKF